ncbi:UPF0323 family lipoprotein [Campylobacter pinnipediorum]|uniref:UPF0323 family lipoprotein n=1 Tax=Campylobacter pinnipediorum TaxID=1965231 RepID=UPI000994928E|nr:UPF0323 family lipoprotein [Campylobacter pinnipediorum]AQW82347.1 putative lipoprotein [Campylobacter pinnipediorum subsp. pinnipediorum]
MKHIKKIATYAAIGGFGALVMAGLSGCGNDNSFEQSAKSQVQNGAFVVIEETAPRKYKVREEYPSSETRVVLKSLDGSERVLTKEEMDELIAKENAKIDNGTSNLTNPNAQISNGGAGLGEILLSSAAGAIIGSWIGNKLFGNQNFQNQRQTAYKSPSAYSRSADSFKNAKTTSSKAGSSKSGFFGGGSKSSSSRQSFGG